MLMKVCCLNEKREGRNSLKSEERKRIAALPVSVTLSLSLILPTHSVHLLAYICLFLEIGKRCLSMDVGTQCSPQDFGFVEAPLNLNEKIEDQIREGADEGGTEEEEEQVTTTGGRPLDEIKIAWKTS